MKLISDYHIHSKNSRFFHGKSTIEEIVMMANELGLEEIAITDHGYNHVCGTNFEKMKLAREKIDEINKTSTVKVYLGIEADIISEDGTLDVDERTLELIDILIVGYHKMIKTNFAGFFGHQKKNQESIKKCTNAFVNAIKRYPVTIVSHLDSILTTNLYEIGSACEEKGVLVEINNRHLTWNKDQVNDLLASGCSFVVSSDAHKASEVGNVVRAFKFIKKYKIPSELFHNVKFENNEKSEIHRELDEDLEFFERFRRNNEEKRRKFLQRQEEYSPKLSDEMEEKLFDIATKNNLNYNQREQFIEDKLPDLPLSREEALLVAKAEAIIAGKNVDYYSDNEDKVLDSEITEQKDENKNFIVDMSTGRKIEIKNKKNIENNNEITGQFGGFLDKSKKAK